MSSPVFGRLESSLAEYLTDLTHRVTHRDDRVAAAVARTEVPKLVTALRAVLDEHAPTRTGRCTRCRPHRFSRTPAPCRAYLSAHLCLIALDDDPAEPAPRHPIYTTP